jgi:allantoinase
MKLPRERFQYSAMPERERLQLPDGARMAVYLIVNIEEWDIQKPVAREYVTPPAGVVTVPNIPNWSWHEYGMRVGIWRIMEAMSVRNLRASISVNARVCEGQGEPVAKAALEAGWDFMAHGYAQAALHTVEDQRAVIRKSFEVIERYTGKAPKGWQGPGLHETLDTLDYLAEAGFRFVCDWPMDEHPVEMQTSAGSIMAVPYSFELSDLPMMVVHTHQSDVWLKRVTDQFDRLYEESADQPRIMSMGIHPYIMGVPHRIKYFEAAYDHMLKKTDVWFATADEIYEWFK